ncbi:sodium/solute symporter [Ectothiorhodospiraceae bacterium 2226]|nr:sodium/solute symporter [Ectothiorhodospiraceae bacterium 2226]
MDRFPISNIDLVVMGIYFLLVIGIGFWVARKTHSGDDLFLAGRSLTWGVIGLSLFASNISSTTLIGLSGQAYASGISVANYEWMAALVLVFMAIFVIPFYLRARLTTIPEFFGLRFNSAARNYFSVVTIFLSIVVDTAASLFAGALVLQVFFPQLVLWQTIVVLALVAGLYTAAGGLRAVVYTDTLQAVVLLTGAGILAYMVFGAHGFSWEAATASVPADHLSLVRPLDDPALPWLGLLIGLPVLGFYYWSANQYIAQRVLGARNVQHAQWGAMFGALLKLLPLFLMVLPGAMAIGLYPELENPDLVFPLLVTDLLPVGIVGLVLAGLLAAIMSTIDSTLNSSSTLVVVDFVKPRRPHWTPEQVGRAGRLATLAFMLIAAAWAPQIQHFPGLFAYLQQAFSYIVPPIVAVFLLGLFWRRGNAAGAIAGLALGHAVSLVGFLLAQAGVLTLHFTIVAGLLTLVSAAIFVIASLVSAPPPRERVEQTVWRRSALVATRGLHWYQDYRVHGAAILLLTGLTLYLFW